MKKFNRSFKRTSLFTLTTALTLTLAACSTSTTNPQIKIDNILQEQTGQDGRACIRTTNIRGYAVENDLIKIRTSRKYYVATTLYRCHDLDLAPAVAFDDRFGEACAGTAYIVSRDGRCPIKHVYEFKDREEAFAAIDLAEQNRKELKEQLDQEEQGK